MRYMKGPRTHYSTCAHAYATEHTYERATRQQFGKSAMNPDHDDEFKAAFINATRQKLNELVTARVQIDRDNLQLLLRIMEGSVFLRAVVFNNLYRGI